MRKLPQSQFQVCASITHCSFVASNGRSHFILNTQKREEWRANKKKIQEWGEQRDLIDNMRNEIEKLQDSLREQSEKLEAGEENGAILGRLFERGIIDNEKSALMYQYSLLMLDSYACFKILLQVLFLSSVQLMRSICTRLVIPLCFLSIVFHPSTFPFSHASFQIRRYFIDWSKARLWIRRRRRLISCVSPFW